MLAFVEGDLFASPAQTLVNAVNTAGVMGKGIAAEFRRRYPAADGANPRALADRGCDSLDVNGLLAPSLVAAAQPSGGLPQRQ
jgi:O-acetyl-ADP-ribose deacetylase (regulator of RNase III)